MYRIMDNLLSLVDSLSGWTARIARWLSVILILLLSYEVVMRYVFNSPTVWVMQTSMMVGGALIVMGWAYVLQQDGHVRVDVFYGRLSRRGKAIVNTLGSLIILFPFVGLLAYKAAVLTAYSWNMNETMPETAWYPPVWPIRVVVFVGLTLFLLQAIAQFVRDVRVLLGKGEES